MAGVYYRSPTEEYAGKAVLLELQEEASSSQSDRAAELQSPRAFTFIYYVRPYYKLCRLLSF